MIEYIILTKLNKEIKEKKLLCHKQFGFIKDCGTEINLIRLRQRVHDFKNANNFKDNKYIVFIDLKNDYDKVIHEKNYFIN